MTSTDDFYQAVAKYIDEIKPDPLSRKQAESWSFEWKESGAEVEDDDEIHDQLPPMNGDSVRCKIQGALEISGEYLKAQLVSKCIWIKPNKINDENSKDGSLYLSIRARVRFLTKSELAERDKATTEENMPEALSKKEKKAQEKIRSKMIQRLKSDAYIQPLLSQDDDGDDAKKSSSSDASTSGYHQLLKAKICVKGSELEERVDVTDDVAEGIRRAIFSKSDSPLEMVEALLFLPLLPYNDTPLANRAKLRLLEDSMFDACEKEDEDEVSVKELEISKPQNDQQQQNERIKRAKS